MMSMMAACLIALPGPIVEPFAPVGRYGGHWGVDVAVTAGGPVVAPVSGIVTFAGTVAGMRTVTIRHGTTQVGVSYLASVVVATGDRVTRGQTVGAAGTHGGRSAAHVSVRRTGVYVDPLRWSCPPATIGGILRLLPPMLATLVEAPS